MWPTACARAHAPCTHPTTRSAVRHDEPGELASVFFESRHPSQLFTNVLAGYRCTFPAPMWDRIDALFDDVKQTCGFASWACSRHASLSPTHPPTPSRHPSVVDLAIGAEGRGGVELARRGFHVTSVEADPTLLARTCPWAQARRASLDLITARAEHALLHDGCADMVTCFHGLHLVDTDRALEEAHRLMRPGGLLVAAWNDRDLSSPFICQVGAPALLPLPPPPASPSAAHAVPHAPAPTYAARRHFRAIQPPLQPAQQAARRGQWLGRAPEHGPPAHAARLLDASKPLAHEECQLAARPARLHVVCAQRAAR